MLESVFHAISAVAIAALLGWWITHAGARQRKILDEEMADPSGPDLFAFFAMEYRLVIFNRSYVVFCSPEGLYGWKFMGTVDNSNPHYFEPLQKRLQAPGSRRHSFARNLATRPGSFFVPRGDIERVDLLDKKKWGMGAIPHSGILRIFLTSGRHREFILLGAVNGDEVKLKVLGA